MVNGPDWAVPAPGLDPAPARAWFGRPTVVLAEDQDLVIDEVSHHASRHRPNGQAEHVDEESFLVRYVRGDHITHAVTAYRSQTCPNINGVTLAQLLAEQLAQRGGSGTNLDGFRAPKATCPEPAIKNVHLTVITSAGAQTVLPAMVSRLEDIGGYAARAGDAWIFVVGDLPNPTVLRINSG